jgi:CRP-like cAMP-binding protein
MPEPFDIAASALAVHPEIADFLARNPDLEALKYRDGEFLMKEGEESVDIFVLLSGGLVVERAPALPGAPPSILACLSAEEGVAIVGEMAYLGHLRRTASVRSAGMSEVLRLAPRHIDRIIEAYPMLTRVICMQFSRRLQETLQTLSHLQARFALSPASRVAQDGDELFAQGAEGLELHQLLAGAVRLQGDGWSRTVTPESAPQGFVDMEDFLRGGPRTCSATVEGMAFLMVIGAQDREAVVRCFPDLALAALRSMSPGAGTRHTGA